MDLVCFYSLVLVLLLHLQISKILTCFDVLEHGIHPPSSRENPWTVPEVEESKHIFAAHEGVYHVYEDEEHLAQKKELNYEYPNLDTFLTDMNTMCQMIADGPL